MQVIYKYYPEQVEFVEKETKHSAYFFVELRCNGELIKFDQVDRKARLTGKNVTVKFDGYQFVTYDNSKNPELCTELKIDRWGKYLLDLDPARMQAVKRELPLLFKKLPDFFPQEPVVDLITGEPVKKQVTVEYRFVDATKTKETVEEKSPAQVFFTCPAPNKCVRVGGLEFDPSYSGSCFTSNNVWSFAELGWINVPSGIHWTEAAIETAFRELAKKLIAESDQNVKVWNFKRTTEYCLESE